MAIPTIEVFLTVSGCSVIILIPFIVIAANTERVAPPTTGAGMVVSNEDIFGIKPATRIIKPAWKTLSY